VALDFRPRGFDPRLDAPELPPELLRLGEVPAILGTLDPAPETVARLDRLEILTREAQEQVALGVEADLVMVGPIVPLGEKGLRWAIQQFVEHYHRERPHQGLGSRIIDPEPNVGSSKGAIVRRMRLGGLLNYYYRVAS
jgi:hypothetical protein